MTDRVPYSLKRFAAFLIMAVCIAGAGMALAQEESGACPILISAPEIPGETVICGQIMVPQDWSDPDDAMIPIAYVVLKSTSLAPLPDPVIYFQGGPGGSALNSFAQIRSGTEALRASRDVIFFDQRGTAHSNELYCPLDAMAVNPET